MSEKLSVVIITLNEEKNIGRCLEAASKVADEIIVVDSFSTDDTKDICLEKGAVFINHAFEGYGKQKNFAISQASNDLILSLDADEVLSPRLIDSIKEIKIKPTHDSYYLKRMSFYVDRFIRHGHWFPDKKLRLFYKTAGSWSLDNVHELYNTRKGKTNSTLSGVIYHYTFYSVFDHIKQANKYSEIGAKQHRNENIFFLLIKAIFSPTWSFFYGYLARLGFLDGLYGLIIAVISSNEAFLKYAKALVLTKQHQKKYNVIQISSMKTWRGGEQQVAYLMTELRALGKEPYMVVSKNSSLEQFCIDNKFQYSSIRFGNGFNLFAAWKLKAITVRYKIELIHMHCSPSHTLTIVSNMLGNKAKMVLSRRVDFPIKNNILSIKKYNHRQIKNILCVSEKINEIITPVIKNKEIIKTVYSGIDLNKFSSKKEHILRKQYAIDRKSILIGNIASIANHKDYFTFVNTAEVLLNQGLKAKFFIIGDDGGEEMQVRNFVKEKNLDDDIIFTGFRTDIREVLPELDVFLFTSKEEGLGTSVLDAMASNVPIVATRAGGIPEMITDGQNGLLCGIKNPEELANAVTKLVQNDELRESIVQNGRVTVQKFSKEKTASETMACYMDILN